MFVHDPKDSWHRTHILYQTILPQIETYVVCTNPSSLIWTVVAL